MIDKDCPRARYCNGDASGFLTRRAWVQSGQTEDSKTGIRGYPARRSAFRDSMEKKNHACAMCILDNLTKRLSRISIVKASRWSRTADENKSDLSLSLSLCQLKTDFTLSIKLFQVVLAMLLSASKACLLVGLILSASTVNGQNAVTNQSVKSTTSIPTSHPRFARLTARGECGISAKLFNALKDVSCPYEGAGKSLLTSRKQELRCCALATANFEIEWSHGGSYLQTYLEKLKLWRCFELDHVCRTEMYSRFSQYSNLSVMYHCDNAKFREICAPELSSARGLPVGSDWEKALDGFVPSRYGPDALAKPCIQVASYHSDSGGLGYYHEVVQAHTPFCDISWCGFDTASIDKFALSSWNCLSSSCQTSLIIACVACGLLAFAIVLANVTVIAVFTTSPKLRNSQAVYKISLAIADLIVGIFVIPTFISSLLLLHKSGFSMGEVIANASQNSVGAAKRLPGTGGLVSNFTTEYLNFVGFFTVLSLMVSIYTLMLASCDRFMAIYQPLRYGRHNAKRIATWASLLLWVIAIFVSALPLFLPEFRFGIAASIMVAVANSDAALFYGIILIIPLVLVWISTVATYASTLMHAFKRRHLTVRRTNSGSRTASNMETRLAKTLAAMVGVFTMCILPPVIMLVVPLFVPKLLPFCVDTFQPYDSKVVVSAEFVAILLLMTNSLWNCFIYNARSEDFKMTAKRLHRRFLVRIGAKYVWGRTRSWASTTMRSGRHNTSSARPSLRKMISKTSLRTVSSEQGTENQDKNNRNSNDVTRTSSTGTKITEFNQSHPEKFAETTSGETNNAFEAPAIHETARENSGSDMV